MTDPDSRPRLRIGVRLAHDHVRDAPVLLFPEGVLILNDTAAAVLGECDGNRSVAEIAAGLARRYQGVLVADIVAVLDRLAARQVVELS